MSEEHTAATGEGSDEELLTRILALLTDRVTADPYGPDSNVAEQIRVLPIGLRAMAATHHLDISLTLDDLGWHFLNFGSAGLVEETERGLRELGLEELAGWFLEAAGIVLPLIPSIQEPEDYFEIIEKRGLMDRIDELTRMARETDKLTGNAEDDSTIYQAWIQYARQYPDRVFGG